MADGPERYCAYLESLTPATLKYLDQYVSADVHFRDPFNDVTGINRMRAIFEDMFENISNIEFVIADRLTQNQTTIITWTLSGVLLKKSWSVEGASKLTFDDDGLLTAHIDYWDAAGGLYEHFPVVGWLPRVLRRKLRTRP